ncbi:MAG: hypothetical protein AAFQ32_04520 [Pseudomonadota bacterium]
MKPTVLIDADVVAFSAAAACEEAIEWAEGYWTWNADFHATKNACIVQVERIMDELKGHEHVLCLSDHTDNFRLDWHPEYKHQRKGGKRPLVLQQIKEWMVEELDAKRLPRLEGDDLLGILATMKSKRPRVVVSIDKDLRTIPCTFYRDIYDDPVEVDETMADYNFLLQTLTGDITDGYPGCPGIGPSAAASILEVGAPVEDNWEAVVDAYEDNGLGVEEAICQARCARILRASDYNIKKKEITPWTPQSFE